MLGNCSGNKSLWSCDCLPIHRLDRSLVGTQRASNSAGNLQVCPRRGIGKFYLGGFSNGGLSINRLASQLKNEKGLAGLIFIDGIQGGESIRDTGLPVLVIQGTQDERVHVDEVRQVVKAIGSSATYEELDADHFLIMKQPDPVQDTIIKWLENFEPALYALPGNFDTK